MSNLTSPDVSYKKYFKQVIACSTGGLDLLVTLLSPAWTEAQESLIIQNGLESIPSKVKLGLQAGLNIISIQMECPMSNKPRHQLFEKKLTLGNREMLHKQYLSALENGWDWPLLYMVSNLGGEKFGWNGLLGECLYKASCYAQPCVIGSACLWFLWCISYKISPNKSLIMMISFALSLITQTLLYGCIMFSSCPKVILPDGRELILRIGWCMKLTGGLGTSLILVGLGIAFTKERDITKQTTPLIIRDSRVSISDLNEIETSFNPSKSDSSCSFNTTKSNVVCDKQREFLNIDDENRNMSPTSLSTMFVL